MADRAKMEEDVRVQGALVRSLKEQGAEKDKACNCDSLPGP